MNKIAKIFLVLLIALSFTACNQNNTTDKSGNGTQNNTTDKSIINSKSTLKNFEGKPSVILFGGTYCPHCVKEVPILKAKVYDFYKDEVNIWVNVVDGQTGKTFDVADIPQGYNKNLSYNDITKEDCGYVPSWVLLDKDGKVALSSCGNSKTNEELIEGIQSLLK